MKSLPGSFASANTSICWPGLFGATLNPSLFSIKLTAPAQTPPFWKVYIKISCPACQLIAVCALVGKSSEKER